jgi:hypothetical protein
MLAWAASIHISEIIVDDAGDCAFTLLQVDLWDIFAGAQSENGDYDVLVAFKVGTFRTEREP